MEEGLEAALGVLKGVLGYLVCQVSYLPSRSSLHPPHHALCPGLQQQAASPSGFQLGLTKVGGPGEKMDGQESKVREFTSQHGHFSGLWSCQ